MNKLFASALATTLVLTAAVSSPVSARTNYVMYQDRDGYCLITTTTLRAGSEIMQQRRNVTFTVLGPSLEHARMIAKFHGCRTIEERE